MNKASLKRLFLIGIVGSLTASALVGIFVLLNGNFDETDWKVLGTTLAVGIASLTSLANLRTLESVHPSYRAFSIASIAISIASFVLATYLIWESYDGDFLGKLEATLLVLAVSSAHTSLLLPLRDRGIRLMTVVSVTQVFIVAVAAMLIYLAWMDWWSGTAGDFFYRLLGVFAILDVLGTIVAPILARFTPKSDLLAN